MGIVIIGELGTEFVGIATPTEPERRGTGGGGNRRPFILILHSFRISQNNFNERNNYTGKNSSKKYRAHYFQSINWYVREFRVRLKLKQFPLYNFQQQCQNMFFFFF